MAKVAAAKAKAKEKAARIIEAAKVKASQVKWKANHDAAKKIAAIKAGKVADPKAAKAALANANKAASAKAKAIVDKAKAKAKAQSAAIVAKASGAKPPAKAPAASAKATPQVPQPPAGKPMDAKALSDARDRVKATATTHEIGAAIVYSGHSYEQINTSLRTGQFQDTGLDKGSLDRTIGHLDALMEKNKVTSATLTFRGSAPHASFSSLKPGEVFVDKAFVSTTTDRNMIFGNDSAFNGGVLFHITSPPGTKLAGIPSQFPNEKEMLLGRGTAFRLDREEKGSSPNGSPLRILHVTVVGQH